MSAPTLQARGIPEGIKLAEGFHIKHAFERSLTFSIWEKAVKIPTFDGGEPIEQTTQHNTTYETSAPRSLIKVGPMTYKGAYDPNCISQGLAMINQPQAMTDIFPDGSTLTYFGYLQKIEFDDQEIGKQPEATVTVIVTNYDPVGHVEAAPVLVSVAGT